MNSPALETWRSVRLVRLDRLLDAHPESPGSRTDPRVTEEWGEALILRLASEFQGFSRDLHDDAIRAVVRRIESPDARLLQMITAGLRVERRLDRGSAVPASLSGDFGRLGIDLWGSSRLRHDATSSWLASLHLLHRARNGAAHDDQRASAEVRAAGWGVDLMSTRRWRNTLDEISTAMDDVVGRAVAELLGIYPWESGRL